MEKSLTLEKNEREMIIRLASQAIINSSGVKHVRNVKLAKSKDGIYMDIFLTVGFSYKIPEIAWNLQKEVKDAITKSTKIPLKRVNIHVEGVEE